MIIYKITNKTNGKIYIGQTNRSLEERWHGHCTCSPERSAIASAIQKYGKDAFEVEELAKASSQEQLNTLEKEYIEVLGSLAPSGYNLKEGGEQLGTRYTNISKEKMRQAKLGTSISGEVRIKMSSSHKKRFETDPSLAIARSKQSKAMWEDQDYKTNMSKKRKEYWTNPEHRQFASEKAKANITDELKKQISLAVKTAFNTPEVQIKMAKFYKTQQREVVASDGREFASIKEAASVIGCPGSSIVKNIQGKYKSAGGLTWKYKDEI